MQISPRSPSATYFVGSVTSANFNTTRGTGMPQEPSFGSARIGLNVPDGDVSVIPQPSASVVPESASNFCCTSSGSGAPPDAQYFSDDMSRSAIPGYISIAVYIVGTP